MHYSALERVEPSEPRWPHRRGDLLKRLGRKQEAIGSYERAVDLYAQQGFVARAAAMAKVVIAMEPERIDEICTETMGPYHMTGCFGISICRALAAYNNSIRNGIRRNIY